jgi:hypothetical protein
METVSPVRFCILNATQNDLLKAKGFFLLHLLRRWCFLDVCRSMKRRKPIKTCDSAQRLGPATGAPSGWRSCEDPALHYINMDPMPLIRLFGRPLYSHEPPDPSNHKSPTTPISRGQQMWKLYRTSSSVSASCSVI